MATRVKSKYLDEPCIPYAARYTGDNSRALQLLSVRGEPVATVTVWVPGLDPDEVAIKDYEEGEGMLRVAIDAGWVYSPHRYVPTGYAKIPVCKTRNWPEEEDA